MVAVPPFGEIRREHERVLAAVARVEAALCVPAGSEGGRASLSAALSEFLRFCETAIEAHLRLEEGEVYPLLAEYLPAEVGSAETMLQEHETLRGLLSELRLSRQRLDDGSPHAESAIAVLVEDVALLLRDHIRKEDHVIHPLLERLLDA